MAQLARPQIAPICPQCVKEFRSIALSSRDALSFDDVAYSNHGYSETPLRNYPSNTRRKSHNQITRTVYASAATNVNSRVVENENRIFRTVSKKNKELEHPVERNR